MITLESIAWLIGFVLSVIGVLIPLGKEYYRLPLLTRLKATFTMAAVAWLFTCL